MQLFNETERWFFLGKNALTGLVTRVYIAESLKLYGFK
jgi:hypothetical protein